MTRIALAKHATWALAFLTGAGALAFALAYVVFPPRRPAPVRMPEGRPTCGPRGDRDSRDFSAIWTNDFNIKPPPPREENPLAGARLDATMTGPAGSTAAITTRDGSQILVSEKDLLFGARIRDISPGTVTLDDGASLKITRGERR